MTDTAATRRTNPATSRGDGATTPPSSNSSAINGSGSAPRSASTPWERLRAPFPPEHIGVKPQPLRRDSEKGKCDECGGWHKLPALHLDVINHAEVTDRLLSVDPGYELKPYALDEDGLPLLDRDGSGRVVGMWFTLTVNGVTHMEYGTTEDGSVKNLLSDCIKRGGMRFGVGLDLWRKLERNQAGDEAGDGDGRTYGTSRRQRGERIPCEECAALGIRSQMTLRDKGPHAGKLQCSGRRDGEWLNHWKAVEAPTDTNTTGERAALLEWFTLLPQPTRGKLLKDAGYRSGLDYSDAAGFLATLSSPAIDALVATTKAAVEAVPASDAPRAPLPDGAIDPAEIPF